MNQITIPIQPMTSTPLNSRKAVMYSPNTVFTNSSDHIDFLRQGYRVTNIHEGTTVTVVYYEK